MPRNIDETSSTATLNVKGEPAPLDELASADNALLVDWDGPDDPANPKNWPYRRKWAATIVVSSFTFISPVSSSMVAPATLSVAADFGVTNNTIIAMMTSIFVLGYGEPIATFPCELVLNINYEKLWDLWFLAGLGGSAPLAIGGGVLGDVWYPEERGKAIAIYSLAPLLGPVVGPVCGAWIAERSTWRWVFWSTSIVDAAVQISGLFFLQETFAPLLLERKAAAIRKSMDPEKAQTLDIHTIYEKEGQRSWSQIFRRALTRPFMIFGHEHIAQLLGIYVAFVYGLFYLFLTNMPTIFEGTYGEKTSIAGLHYIALGAGLTVASQVNARYMDRIYVYFKNKNNGVGEPEFRLPAMVPGTFILPAGLLIAGWAADQKVHWIVTDIGIAMVGCGMILLVQACQTYVVDTFTLHAASALAAVTCLRSLAGFGFPLFAPAMFHKLGYGKGSTILACVAIVLGCPAPWLFWKYGKQIRSKSTYARKSVDALYVIARRIYTITPKGTSALHTDTNVTLKSIVHRFVAGRKSEPKFTWPNGSENAPMMEIFSSAQERPRDKLLEEKHQKELAEKDLKIERLQRANKDSLKRHFDAQHRGNQLALALGFSDIYEAQIAIDIAGHETPYKECFEHVDTLQEQLKCSKVENCSLRERIAVLEAAATENNHAKDQASRAFKTTISRLEQELTQLQGRYDDLLDVKERAAERYKTDYAKWRGMNDWLLAENAKNAKNAGLSEEEKKKRDMASLMSKKKLVMEVAEGLGTKLVHLGESALMLVTEPTPSPYSRPPPLGGITNLQVEKKNQTTPTPVTSSHSTSQRLPSLRSKLLDAVSNTKSPSSSPTLFNEGSLSRTPPTDTTFRTRVPSSPSECQATPPRSSPTVVGTTSKSLRNRLLDSVVHSKAPISSPLACNIPSSSRQPLLFEPVISPRNAPIGSSPLARRLGAVASSDTEEDSQAFDTGPPLLPISPAPMPSSETEADSQSQSVYLLPLYGSVFLTSLLVFPFPFLDPTPCPARPAKPMLAPAHPSLPVKPAFPRGRRVVSSRDADTAQPAKTRRVSDENDAEAATRGSRDRLHNGNGRKGKEREVESPMSTLANPPPSTKRIDDYSAFKGRGSPKDTINAQFEIDPTRNGGMNFQYDEVVRGRDDRRRMDAGDCECCRDYYEAVGPLPKRLQAPLWKSPPTTPVKPCPHHPELSASGSRDANAPPNSSASRKRRQSEIDSHRQAISRHRHHWERPKTPPGYWNIGFPDTQEADDINERAKEMHRRKRHEVEAAARKEDGKYRRRSPAVMIKSNLHVYVTFALPGVTTANIGCFPSTEEEPGHASAERLPLLIKTQHSPPCLKFPALNMAGEKHANESDSPSKVVSPSTIVTTTFGVWKFLTLKEPPFSLQPMVLLEWNKFTATIPHIYRLLCDVYNLNPPLVVLYLISRAWRGIEPGITMYVSSQLYVELELYLRDGHGNSGTVIRAILMHLFCVMLSTFGSTLQNRYIPKLTSQAELFFEEHLMREKLRYDVHTLSRTLFLLSFLRVGLDLFTVVDLKTSRPSSYMGWYSFSEIIEASVGILSLFSIVMSILFQHHGGTVFTTLCLIYPLVGKLARHQWSQGIVILTENEDYLRLKAFGALSGLTYREDIVNNNLPEYIMKEYKKSRERLGTLFTGNPLGEMRLENSALFQLFRAMSGEVPVLYFTCIALLDPASHSMSTLAILRQQSATLTGSVQTTFQMFSHIMYTLETVKNLYHVEALRLSDGEVEYQPPQVEEEAKGMSFELRNVSFAYPGSKAKEGALKDVTLDIKTGQLVVVVGSNGSGKSTLIKLLTRTYDVTSGEILLDKKPIQTYKLATLHDATALLNQDHTMYPLSLAENIGLGYSACVTDHDMINAAIEKGGASDVIGGLKEGLATILDPVETAVSYGIDLPRHQALQDVLDSLELTSKVSGGEKQRLVASRTFMRLQNPNIKLVAVDEPSSALDPRGELELFNSLRSERDGRTMIFVTHRFGHLTKHADLIVCMKDGNVVESGSHKDLLARNGEYATLYNIQAQAFTSESTDTIAETRTPPDVDDVESYESSESQ
ncbi:hypothetical protein DXG01_011404 [Tephrocybe rancida]|nr:hypothetical protein DXG01_011404 [Tephrocybe rancida]